MTVPGVWKYRQITTSDDHRAALLYSFATLPLAVFVGRSPASG
jgi:hypothetical protein